MPSDFEKLGMVILAFGDGYTGQKGYGFVYNLGVSARKSGASEKEAIIALLKTIDKMWADGVWFDYLIDDIK